MGVGVGPHSVVLRGYSWQCLEDLAVLEVKPE